MAQFLILDSGSFVLIAIEILSDPRFQEPYNTHFISPDTSSQIIIIRLTGTVISIRGRIRFGTLTRLGMSLVMGHPNLGKVVV